MDLLDLDEQQQPRPGEDQRLGKAVDAALGQGEHVAEPRQGQAEHDEGHEGVYRADDDAPERSLALGDGAHEVIAQDPEDHRGHVGQKEGDEGDAPDAPHVEYEAGERPGGQHERQEGQVYHGRGQEAALVPAGGVVIGIHGVAEHPRRRFQLVRQASQRGEAAAQRGEYGGAQL